MGKGRFKVSYNLLKEALHLPPTTEIYHVEADEGRGCMNVFVDHHEIPDASGVVIDVCPALRYNKPIEFIDWGLEEKE